MSNITRRAVLRGSTVAQPPLRFLLFQHSRLVRVGNGGLRRGPSGNGGKAPSEERTRRGDHQSVRASNFGKCPASGLGHWIAP
jgi:hypothetical protein